MPSKMPITFNAIVQYLKLVDIGSKFVKNLLCIIILGIIEKWLRFFDLITKYIENAYIYVEFCKIFYFNHYTLFIIVHYN